MNNTSTLAKQKQGDEIEQLERMVDFETRRRKVLTEFIKNHMVEGVDFGKIHIKRDCQDKYNCKVESHFSKPSLFKPGSEKFSSLMKLRPVFRRDDETWEMYGKRPGLVCYKCELIDQKGKVVGEGRGAANLAEKTGWTENNAVKIAQKRAQIDAVLRTGGLSDFFTQDLEDAAVGNGNSEKVIQKVRNIDPESTTSYQKCKYCGTMGKYHKKGCPGGDNPSAAEVIANTDVGSVQDVT